MPNVYWLGSLSLKKIGVLTLINSHVFINSLISLCWYINLIQWLLLMLFHWTMATINDRSSNHHSSYTKEPIKVESFQVCSKNSRLYIVKHLHSLNCQTSCCDEWRKSIFDHLWSYSTTFIISIQGVMHPLL